MKLICSKDIFCRDVNEYIYDLLNSENNYLYLTCSSVINSERKKVPILNTLFSTDNKIMCFKVFLKSCSKKVYESKNYLPNLDISYILSKIIDNYLNDKNEKALFKSVQYKLLELYNILIFNDVDFISKETMNKIQNNNSIYGFKIFDIYNALLYILTDIIQSFSSGNKVYVNETLDLNILAPNGTNENFDVFIRSYKKQIYERISSIDFLILDGFFILNEQLNFIVKTALDLNKEVIIITKDLKNDENARFLIENMKSNFNIKNESIDYITFSNNNDPDTSISYLSNHFYDITNKCTYTYVPCDDTINIFRPFLNRTQELRFVAKQISAILRAENVQDENEVENILNDIVIVTAVNYNKLSEELDNELKKYGIFVYRGIPIKIGVKNVCIKNLKKVYYSADEFLSSEVFFDNGSKLGIEEKTLFFSKAYKRISVKKENSSLLYNPILEYVFQLYNFLYNGINTKSFKLLLFSNWYYYVEVSTVQWNKYMGTFHQIESYLPENVSIENWILQIKDILKYKDEIALNPLYKLHPFNSIDKKDLQFILDLLNELNVLVNLLSVMNGSAQNQLKFLKEKILKIDKISSYNRIDLTEEQLYIKNFCDTLEALVSDSTIAYLDSSYFAMHLRILFYNLNESNEYETNDFNLNVSNMLNIKKYKYSFFIACESNKYPRQNIRAFPFNDSLVDILTNDKYGINIKGISLKTPSFHLQLEKYLFKNVIDFTTDKIYYTCTQYAEKNMVDFSIYVKNILEVFKGNIKLVEPRPNTDSRVTYGLKKISPIYTFSKNVYTLKELITFHLCPKLYYHLYINPIPIAYITKNHLKLYAQAVLYSDLLGRFMDYNFKNKKWYFSDNKEVYNILVKLMEESVKNNIKYFDCLKILDIIQIKENVLRRIINLIENYIINNLGYHKYTIVRSSGKNYKCKNFILKLEYDTAIFTDKKGSRRIDQNNLYLDFLTLKCTSNKIKETHYRDMLKLLHTNNKFLDRIFFANRMISKINVQFNSGTDKFINGSDGAVERVNNLRDEILHTDFSKIKPMKSNFCSYCIMRDICMGGKEIQKSLGGIE